MTSTLLLWAASIVSAVCFAAHAFGGGRIFVRPLMENSTLPAAVKSLSYVSWHCVSLLFLASAVTFGYVALHPRSLELAVLISMMTGATAAMIIGMAFRGHEVMFKLPAAYFFGLITLLGTTGILFR